MRELTYTVLELEEWNRKSTCDFCFNTFKNSDNKAVNQIITRLKSNGELITNDCICENCKVKFENDELPKCGRCGRLQTRTDVDIHSRKYVCYCIRHRENLEEKELPTLPNQRESMATFYERQINTLQEEKTQLTEEVDTHLEALEISEVWNKRQKQELLDRIKELETEVERLKKQTPQELLDEISKLKERVKELEEQNNQSIAQVEVKTDKKFRFLPFGRK